MAEPKTLPKNYENNPFFVASNGFTLLFDKAKRVGLFLLGLSIIQFIASSSGRSSGKNEATAISVHFAPVDWLFLGVVAFIFLLAFAMIAALLGGVASYTSARLSQGKSVGLKEAFHVAFDNLWGYLWLQIIIFVKIFLWSLIFIIPGIIMAVRYSLAGVAYFDENKNLRGNAAIKESLRLTKGAWLTTFASQALFNLLTLGSISHVVSTSANAVLYRQFDKLGDKKPDAHWLSWLTLLLPFVFIFFILSLIVAIGVAIGLLGPL